MILSVTLCMKIIETADESLYSGVPNGLNWFFVSVHNETTDPLTRMNNVENSYHILIYMLIKARSVPSDHFVQPFPRRVQLKSTVVLIIEARFSCEILYLGIFLVDNMGILVEIVVSLDLYTSILAREKCHCSM